MCGPGSDDAGAMWLHGPISSSFSHRSVRERAKGVVAVAVGPTGDDHRRALDAGVVGTHRAVPPVRPVELLVHPAQQPRLVLGDARQPLVAPPVTPDRRHGRQRVHRGHVVAVVDEVDRPQRSAHVVHVVGVAVVGGVDRADRAERRRALARQLQRVEAGVAVAEHPDTAVAPRLRGRARRSRRSGRRARRSGTRRWPARPTSRCRGRSRRQTAKPPSDRETQVVVGVRLAVRSSLRYGSASSSTGAGLPSLGRYRSAASRVPSRAVIHTCSQCTGGSVSRWPRRVSEAAESARQQGVTGVGELEVVTVHDRDAFDGDPPTEGDAADRPSPGPHRCHRAGVVGDGDRQRRPGPTSAWRSSG